MMLSLTYLEKFQVGISHNKDNFKCILWFRSWVAYLHQYKHLRVEAIFWINWRGFPADKPQTSSMQMQRSWQIETLMLPTKLEFATSCSKHRWTAKLLRYLSLAKRSEHSHRQPQIHLEYASRTSHLALQWLPTKLAECIGKDSLRQDELGFPYQGRSRRGWTKVELNALLENYVARDQEGTSFLTCGYVEWESEIYREIMPERCQPFDMAKYSFHSTNPQVRKGHPRIRCGILILGQDN